VYAPIGQLAFIQWGGTRVENRFLGELQPGLPAPLRGRHAEGKVGRNLARAARGSLDALVRGRLLSGDGGLKSHPLGNPKRVP